MTESLAAAYSTNPQLNVARAQLRSVDEDIAIARSQNRPLVEGSVQYLTSTTQVHGAPLVAGHTASNTLGFSLQLTQPIFQGFQVRNSIRQAEASVLAQRSELEVTEQDILLQTAVSFLDVLLFRQIVKLRTDDVEFLGEQVRAARDRFEVGEGTRTDVSQAEARRAESQALLNASEANYEAARATYQRQTNLVANNLRDNFNVERLLPKSLPDALNVGQQRHPAIMASLHNVDVNIFNVATLEGQFLPSLGATASASSTFQTVGRTERTDDARVGLNLTIPIYQRGLVSARVRQSKESLGAARLQVDVNRNIVRQSVATSWSSFQSSVRSIRNAQTGVFSAQLALEGVIEEQRVGQRTTLDVLDAQRDLISAQITLVNAQRDKDAAAFQLLSNVGRLNVTALGINVAAYRPEEHTDSVRNKWYGAGTPDGR
ncbi:TolC family outer membrane protein [Acuticoccus sp. I52.16.1]|uniref:TolC family outer membrane protein n=1 Tax=Acuticoccus sp. I52.16.1 TaxID=2928472 RepID=UPI001FD0316C|nr:TolC family outer membrane protein [Acuticoccus sp. I52.16.1]UOM35205.1 TolC family outer membrane protein [Acuticoccus sp. I52.16.1]